MSTAEASATTGATPYPGRWMAAIVMVCAVLMDMIDITIVNVALPTIGRDLGASGTQVEWVVSAYMLAFAAALITGALPIVAGLFLVAATLALVLPPTAVSEEEAEAAT
jgi:MFS family permease